MNAHTAAFTIATRGQGTSEITEEVARVVRALAAARALRLRTVGLLGGHASPAREHCDLAIVVPSHETGRIQECHITIGHALMELVEEMLIKSGQLTVE